MVVENEIEIEGKRWILIREDTPSSLRAEGMPHVADYILRQGIGKRLWVRKPRGKGVFVVDFTRSGSTHPRRMF